MNITKTARGRRIGIFIAIMLIFGTVFQYGAPVFAKELPNAIKPASIADETNQPLTEVLPGWKAFRINVDFELPDEVHKGDTTTIKLTDGMEVAPPQVFEIKDGEGNVIANAKMMADPGKLVITYADYVEGRTGIKGKFNFNAQINDNVITQEGDVPVNLTVNGVTTNAGTVKYKSVIPKRELIIKGGCTYGQDSSSSQGVYQVKINQENKQLTNVVVKDVLKDAGVKYQPDTLEVYKGKWIKKRKRIRFRK